MSELGDAGNQDDPGVRERLQRQAEDAIGKLADELLENPVFNSALSGAFAAREKVAQAQQQAMGALNLPSASDLDKLERRIRSISRRLDEVEDTVERVLDKLDAFSNKLDTAAEQSFNASDPSRVASDK
jgi:chromosome segregation ATPase